MAGKANSQIITPYGRLSYPNFIKARAFEEGADEFFDCQLLVPKPDSVGKMRFDGLPFSPWGDAAKHDLTLLRQLIKEREAEKWGAKPPKGLIKPIKDADVVAAAEDGEEPDETPAEAVGHFSFRAKSKKRPLLFDAAKKEIGVDEIESMFYPGAWVRLVVGIYDYDGKKNKGTGFGLRGVQFLRNDTPFAGRIDLDAIDEIPEGTAAPEDLGDMA